MICPPGDRHIKRVLKDGGSPVARYCPGKEDQQGQQGVLAGEDQLGQQGGLHHLSLFPLTTTACFTQDPDNHQRVLPPSSCTSIIDNLG